MRRPGGTFGIPALLAVVSLVALVSGLLGDGAVDAVAWIGLALPLVAIVFHAQRALKKRWPRTPI